VDQALPLPGLHDPETPLRNLLGIVLERFVALDLGIERIAFAHHEASTDLLATFVATEREGSSDGQEACFEARPLALVPSLSRLREQKQGRVLNDLNQDLEPTSPHSRWLLAQGWRASLTLPLFEHNRLLGFLFVDSSRVGAFTPEALARLDPHLDLLLLRIANHFRGIATLHGSLKLVLDMAGLRDRETATHLERVSFTAA
jgi:hypothetical protein